MRKNENLPLQSDYMYSLADELLRRKELVAELRRIARRDQDDQQAEKNYRQAAGDLRTFYVSATFFYRDTTTFRTLCSLLPGT